MRYKITTTLALAIISGHLSHAVPLPSECPCQDSPLPDSTIQYINHLALRRRLSPEECAFICNPSSPGSQTPASMVTRSLPESNLEERRAEAEITHPKPATIDEVLSALDLWDEPPPLFDPPEPRPDPLFDAPTGQQHPQSHLLTPPPIPTSRTEVLSPHDGAHVHPATTPYPPEKQCSLLRQILQIMASLTALLIVTYGLVWMGERVIFLLVRAVRGSAPGMLPRGRGASGSWLLLGGGAEGERLVRERSPLPRPRSREKGEGIV